MAKRKHFSIPPIAIVAIVVVGVMGFLSHPSFSGFAPASRVAATVGHIGATVVVPSHAIQLAPGLFDLGIAIVDGEPVQGFMFIDYKKGFGHKPKHQPGPKDGGGKSTCFKLLAKGARWKTTEPYLLNPTNAVGMSTSFVESRIASSLEAWDTQVAFDVFGPSTTTTDTLVADTVAPDDKNEVYFGAIEGSGSIAVAIVWGIFSGPPGLRKLVEWDIVFDDAEFTFGDADLNSAVMDLFNIGAHEVGHAAGIGHPRDECTEETMYRFAAFGETKKRDLNTGDIAGITELYK